LLMNTFVMMYFQWFCCCTYLNIFKFAWIVFDFSLLNRRFFTIISFLLTSKRWTGCLALS
jgi:hypothetical protein